MARKLWTLEQIRQRCDEFGPCWLWRGCMNDKRIPIAQHGGRTVSVRRLAHTLATGQPIAPGMYLIAECHDARCVSPACSRAATSAERGAHARAGGAYKSPRRIARIRITRERTATVPASVVRLVRESGLSTKDLMTATGLSRQYINHLQRWKARTLVAPTHASGAGANPFSGLGAR